MEARHVVVTGGAGFIGTNLCTRLLQHGDRVTVIDNLAAGRAPGLQDMLHAYGTTSLTFLEADVTDRIHLGEQPVDAVVHLATLVGPEIVIREPITTLRVAINGTLNALEIAHRHNARFVLVSSSEVYGDPLVHPQAESYYGNVDPTGPLSGYDEGKRAAEACTAAYRREHDLNAAIVRPFNIYGPGMHMSDRRVVPAFISTALEGGTLALHGDGSQTRALCYVDDFVDGLLAVMNSVEFGPFNIGNPGEITMRELAEMVVAEVGRGSVVTTPGRVQDAARRCPDITRASEVLGWSPRTRLPDGIARTVAWYRRSTPTPAR
ncbi:NAD-dependent epimerase/dehydratase family protein [Spongiactinospora sp. 9N601]|uniref:NAD-dependent epimerase/dehydratase family protein n=1 Tax=Spongiactinospora sp. 9N601 TaxID=3375149 RepID=UPI00379FFC34